MKKGMRIFTLLLTLAIVDINMTACDTNDISRPDDDNLMGDEHPSDGTISNPDESINPTIGDKAPMSGMVNLWYKNHVPSTTKNVNNSDGPYFIPNIEVFTTAQDVSLKERL